MIGAVVTQTRVFLVFDYCSDNPCDNGGVCKNTERHFVCECQPGYEGDLCQTGMCHIFPG